MISLRRIYLRWRAYIHASIDHAAIVSRLEDDAGWTPRFAFMVVMSAGIAELGLLLSSPAVVIGAMLISPLMAPIMGFGFGLALFDFRSLRRSLIALGAAVPLAVGFTALIVLCSPLRTITPEILARTRPNLFDLLVALFSALAGTFALIRGKGDTIVGVAIATALMPPLATIGFGVATGNSAIAMGASALFMTNFVTIAVAATIMARIYGFGHYLSQKQSWLQSGLVFCVFVAMAVPLGFSLQNIASQAITTAQARAAIIQAAGKNARIIDFAVDFQSSPLTIRTVLIMPRRQAASSARLKKAIEARVGRPVDLQVDQVPIDPDSDGLGETRAVAQGQIAQIVQQRALEIAELVALAAGVAPADVLLDREARRARVAAKPLPGATIATYQALEERLAADADGWSIAIVPPGDLPLVPIPAALDDKGQLVPAARDAIRLDVWAARRWNWPALAIPGLPDQPPPPNPAPAQSAALAVAAAIEAQGIQARPAGDDRTVSVELIAPLPKPGDKPARGSRPRAGSSRRRAAPGAGRGG